MVSILAHELAHHELRHVLAHVQYLKVLGAWGDGDEGTLAAEALTAPDALRLLVTPFRSLQEADADRLAVELTVRAGYSPVRAIRLMQRVDRYYEGGEVEPSGSFGDYVLAELRNVLADHPRARQRACTIAGLVEEMAAAAEPARSYRVGTSDFARRIPWDPSKP
jgi:Zn-dependent protease with chaperone function